MKMWNGLIGACVILSVATMMASAGPGKGKGHGADQALSNAQVMITGTLQAEGKGVSLKAADGTVYMVRPGKDLAEKMGQEVTLTGTVVEKEGKKILRVAGGKKNRDGKGPATSSQAVPPVAPEK